MCCNKKCSTVSGSQGSQGSQGVPGINGSNASSGLVTEIVLNSPILGISNTTFNANTNNYFATSWLINPDPVVPGNLYILDCNFSNFIVNGVYKLYVYNITCSSYLLQFLTTTTDVIYTNFGGTQTINNNNNHIFEIIYSGNYSGNNIYYINNIGNFT